MAEQVEMTVQVLAVHVSCRLCGAAAVIDLRPEDTFTSQVLVPFGAWCLTHVLPHVDSFDVLAGGQVASWDAT